jgi:pilus assembly protein CpaC
MKKNFTVMLAVLGGLFLFAGVDSTLGSTSKEELKLYMGTNLTLSVNNPTRIAIGNPAVADVAQVTKKDMIIVPKAAGSTTLVYWDNFGEQSYAIKVFSEDTGLIKERVDKALENLKIDGVTTKAEDEEGKVFLVGKFDTSGDKERLLLAVALIKDKVVDLTTIREDDAVVEIDVQVLELNKGATQNLGFTWPSSLNISEVGSPGFLATGTTWGKLFKVNKVFRGLDGTANPFELTVNALVQEGKARVLSRPRLNCLSGKEAKLLVGGEVPVLSATVTGGGTQGTTATPGNVEYKEYGIRLNVKPVVKDNNRLYLNLEVEVSEVGATAVETTYAKAYPFTKRTAHTELYLDDGQTMAIGGLIKQKTEEDLTKFPWLADVPVLGMFFRSRNTKEGKGASTRDDSELFITLTPRIVSRSTGVKPEDKKEIRGSSPEVSVAAIDEASLSDEDRYALIVQRRVNASLSYPEAARSSGFQGAVKLALRLSYKGELMEAKIKNSSGYKILDDNALKTAKNISLYPPFPPAIEAQDLWVDVPIVYRLE